MLIELINVFCSIAIAIVGPLTFWPVKSGWDFYIPIVLFICAYIAMAALWWVLVWIFGLCVDQKHEHDKPSKFAKFWFIQAVTFTNYHALVRVRVSGKRRLPKKSRFLFVCNHRSNFDPMIIAEKIGDKDLAFIAKRATFKIPLAHRLMWGICYMPIKRDDPLQSLEVMKRSQMLLETNATSIGVFPEGTRHLNCDFGPFHDGVFNVAIKSKVPLVIASISGTENIHKNFPFRSTHVRFDILETIEPDEMEGMTCKDLAEHAHEVIADHLETIEAK